MTQAQQGDRVRYTGKALRSMGLYTGPYAFREGTLVESAGDRGIAVVRWDDEPERPQRIRVGSLHVVGRPEYAD